MSMRFSDCILACAVFAYAGSSSVSMAGDDGVAVARVAAPADWRELGVGRLATALIGTTIEGERWSFDSISGQKAIVLAMTSSACPVSRKYAPTLARLEAAWRDRGVAFVFINSSEGEDIADIRKQIAEHRLAGTYVMDADHHLAAALGARTTAEVFVLDAARTITYRGAIDDQYGLTTALEAPRHSWLRDAIDATLQGKQPPVRATTVSGCAIEAPPVGGAQPPPTGGVTYHNRISRIVQDNCLECHRTGGVAPFPLETYAQVKSRSAMMRFAVNDGIMPPWFATAAADQPHSPWANDRSLTSQDKADLLAWLDSVDKPEGDPAAAPLARTFDGEWTIAKPDVIVQIPEAVEIKVDGIMPYMHMRVDLDYDDDRWVQAIEVLPTARQVVHHVLVFVVPKAAVGDQVRDAIDETRGFFAAYVPGNGAVTFPEGFARILPKHSSLIFQVHYTPNGAATTDQTRLGMRFAPSPPRHTVRVAGIADRRIRIPPNEPNHDEHASLKVPFDVHVISLMPHMHVRGKAFRFETTLPDGSALTPLDVPRYDFNWQLTYRLREPLALPAGSVINTTAWYDNSIGNPANPDANATVEWGPQTFNEMMLGYIEYYTDAEDGQADFSRPAGAGRDLAAADRFERLLTLLDHDKDGVIAREEVPDRLQRQFKALDRDADGRLTREEMQ